MKTTIDIPDALLAEARTFSGLQTKRDVVVTALRDDIGSQIINLIDFDND